MIRPLALSACLAASPAMAEVPAVVTDLPPIQSLAAMVMGDLGQPAVLLPPGVSPHDFAFRPSDARALSGAGVIIWVGHGLTPSLADPIDTLGAEAVTLELLETPGWAPLPLRHDPSFAESEPHDHAIDHLDMDPHAWLDPKIAAVWVGQIAETLAGADPENAAIYAANARAATVDLTKLDQDIRALTAPLAGRSYVVPHDAFQYFETAFDLPAAGAIALGDAAAPGPVQISTIQDRIITEGITCVLADTQTNPDWVALVTEGSTARTAPIDDIGTGLEPGPGLYPALLRRIASGLATCLK